MRVIVGRSGTGKSRKIFQEIRDWSGEMKHVILVPETISHRTERELCKLCGDSISLRAEVLTFSRLCTKVFHQCGGEHEPELDKAGRMVLLHKSVSHCQEQLQVLHYYAQQASFYEKLVKTIEELKSNCVSTNLLFQMDSDHPQHNKIRDIAMICGFYDSYTQPLQDSFGEEVSTHLGIPLEDLQGNMVAFDPRDRITRLGKKLRESGWGKGICFWLDGFTDFTPQQLEILRALYLDGESMTVCLLGDKEEDQEPDSLFAPTYLTMGQLREMVQNEREELQVEEMTEVFPLRNQVLQHLEQQLFQEIPENYGGQLGGELRLLSALSIRSEVEWVASEIRRLVLGEGYRYGDILVVARNFSLYNDYIASEFARYDIPVYQSEVRDILEKPVISVVQTVLQLLSSHFHTEDVLAYLKTGFSPLSPAQVDRLENYLLMWEEEQWKRPWKKHTRRYDGNISWEKLQELIESAHPKYPELLKQYASNANELQELNALRLRVLRPLEALERAMDEKSGKEQCRALYEFLEDIGLYWRIEQRRMSLEEEGNLAQSSEYQQLWDILCRALEQCDQLFSQEPLAFSEFAKMFSLVLSQYSVSTIPTFIDQVTAGETTRMKSNRKKVVFWLGCEDSVVPMLSNSGGLLTDSDRMFLKDRLSEYHISLNQDEESLLYREMTTAYEICALATEKLYFSWASTGDNGQQRKPSYLLGKLQAMYSDLQVEKENKFPLLAVKSALEQVQAYPFVLDVLENFFQEGSLLEYQPLVAEIRNAKDWNRGGLSPLGVRALYGENVLLSATGLSRLYGCSYSYFLRYGLGAKKREQMKFSPSSYGNMVHFVLEELLTPLVGVSSKEEKYSLGQEALEHADAVLEDYIKNQLGGDHNTRDRFLFQRMKGQVTAVVQEVLEEIRRSAFVYGGGELKFRLPLEALCPEAEASDLQLSFQGSIDRVDLLSQKDTLYYHTVDYKTGSKRLDLGQFYQGRDLQLFLYCLALESLGQEHFASLGLEDSSSLQMAALSFLPGKTEVKKGKEDASSQNKNLSSRGNVRHMGIYHEDVSLLKSMEDKGDEKAKYRYVPIKAWSDTTVELYADSYLVSQEDFQDFQSHCRSCLAEVPKLLSTGDITANPYYDEDGLDSCRFCDFLHHCHFEEGRCGNEKRKNIKIPLEGLRELWHGQDKED